ncbi:hypothetical protein BGLT_04361 [Caballeronia glathei]|jgi:hypothetical protein|uniref:Pvc16 N-terminal domain-containing protein n=1 Tax=Caballeronia glathei TaxID=60547 RepID=A0A069PSB5_9BURK|nr:MULTISPECIES: DUF4255 domain-containing protein [Burkholderiaceae]KDR43623.1 hypothetical protein BG61_32500 [Caballeronia glathei]TCK43731.1 uncharacterized protein DUF4255 [Paraburkholderia sp. BL8N3]CDY75462.1 hypothetical protein BGLT_04361 [Caballeronia glathei]
MIDDLDETLAALLRRELAPGLSEQIQVSFEAPDDQFPPQSVTTPAIDLFLYDVRENLELRSNDAYLERHRDGTAHRMPIPVRVDASYLITAWPREGLASPAEDEHRLLGEVMRALLRHRTLPRDILRGSLAAGDLPLPVSALQPGRLQSLGEFWQAMGGKPKAAINYTVTLSVDVGMPEAVRLVTSKDFYFDVALGRAVARPDA